MSGLRLSQVRMKETQRFLHCVNPPPVIHFNVSRAVCFIRTDCFYYINFFNGGICMKNKIFSPNTETPKVRQLTVTALMGAMSAVLMFIQLPVPMFMPSFIKFDLSELPALIASFAIGPLSGACVCLIKNIINLFSTSTGGVGELSNFILGCAFVVPAGLIYKAKKTKTTAIIGAFRVLCSWRFSAWYQTTLSYIPFTQTLCPWTLSSECTRHLTPR